MTQSVLAYDPRHSLNAICPYFTMFPLEYPMGILKRHAATAVLDPFCGRGTTVYAARVKGIPAYGVDASPVAVAIARAKLARTKSETALQLGRELIATVTPKEIPQGEFWHRAFAKDTLRALCALREGLFVLRSDSAVLLRALVLGCLHGPLTTDRSNPSYLSNQMPRTFGTKPAYSLGFWRRKGLEAPSADVIQVLTKKARRLALEDLPDIGSPSFIVRGNSEHATAFNRFERNWDTVVTSPPYYGMNTYVQDQWLRNWFLGGPAYVDYGYGAQLSHSGQDAFVNALAKVWNNVADSSALEIHLFVRFGALPSRSVDAEKMLRRSLDLSSHKWRIVSKRAVDAATLGRRQAPQMIKESKPMGEHDLHAVLNKPRATAKRLRC